MPSYVYKAKKGSGEELEGVMDGDDQRAVAARLQEMGYFVLDVRAVRERPKVTYNPLVLFVRYIIKPVFGGASPWQLGFFFRQLHTMIKSGLTLTHALGSLGSQGGGGWVLRRIARETTQYLQSGGRLSDAFGRYPWVFSELHIGLIRAGEEGGTLDVMLGRLADYLEREHSVRQKLRISTFYPKLLILAVIFIPRFQTLLFSGFKAYMMETLGILVPILVFIGVLWAAYRILSQIAPFRYAMDLVKLAIPKVGGAVRMLALSKFYRVVAAMFAAGAPVGEALTYGARATGNWYLMNRLQTAVPMVRQGTSMSEALARTRVVPRMALDMLSTGEQAGDVDGMLNKAAEYTETEADVAVMQLTLVIGILFLLAVAGYIGLIVAGFYLGHYSGLM